MDPEEIWTLGALAEERHYHYGAALVKEGSTPDGMFLITYGECQVCIEEKSERFSLFDIVLGPELLLLVGKKAETLKTSCALYPNYYMFHLLSKDDFFGSRMLFSTNQWRKHLGEMLNIEDPTILSNNRDSYLSVVADSAKVKVLVIKRGMLEYLPKRAKKTLLGRIKHFEDVDRPLDRKKFEGKREELKNWQKYKERLTSKITKVRGKKEYN